MGVYAKLILSAFIVGIHFLQINTAPCPGIAHEDSNYTLEAEVDQPVIWWDIAGKTALTCILDPYDCTDPWGNYSGSIWEEDGRYRATLTILRVNRVKHTKVWKWFSNGTTNGECELDVYSRIPTPVCSDFQFSNDLNDLILTCSVSQVYPYTGCEMEYKNSDDVYIPLTEAKISLLIGYRSGNPPYYDINKCIMKVPITFFQRFLPELTHQFKVNMFPKDMTQMGTKKETKVLTLRLPSPELANCPSGGSVKNGLIKLYSSASCQCVLQSEGYPKGETLWLDSTKSFQVNNSDNGPDWININSQNHDADTSYMCRAKSTLGTGNYVIYTPQFAYGPSNIVMTVNGGNRLIKQCDNPITSFFTYCRVLKLNANPAPKMSLQLTNQNKTQIVDIRNYNANQHYYRYDYEIDLSQLYGNVSMKCVASNALFPDIEFEQEGWVNVLVAPPDPPIITINGQTFRQNKEGVNLLGGSQATAHCLVEGGYPAVSKVTMVCAGQTANQSQPFEVFSFDRNEKCQCKAEHETGCYNKELEILIHTIHKPRIWSFNYTTDTIETVVGTTISFLCIAEASPFPKVTIFGPDLKVNLVQTDISLEKNLQQSGGSLVLTCRDTGEYKCKANNSIGEAEDFNINVNVRCAPDLKEENAQGRTSITLTNAKRFTVKIPIIGFPPPNQLNLYKVIKTQDRGQQTKTVIAFTVLGLLAVDASNLATISYNKTTNGSGNVIVKGNIGTNESQFVLTISNGIGDGLNITFSVHGEEMASKSSSFPMETIIGIAVGGGVLCLVIILIAIKVNRRKKKLKEPHEGRTVSVKSDKPPKRLSYSEQGVIDRQQSRQNEYVNKTRTRTNERSYEIVLNKNDLISTRSLPVALPTRMPNYAEGMGVGLKNRQHSKSVSHQQRREDFGRSRQISLPNEYNKRPVEMQDSGYYEEVFDTNRGMNSSSLSSTLPNISTDVQTITENGYSLPLDYRRQEPTVDYIEVLPDIIDEEAIYVEPEFLYEN